MGSCVADAIKCCPNLSFKTETIISLTEVQHADNWHPCQKLPQATQTSFFLDYLHSPGIAHIQELVNAGIQRPNNLSSICDKSEQPSQLQGSIWQQLRLLFQFINSSTSPSVPSYVPQSCTAVVPKRILQQTLCMNSQPLFLLNPTYVTVSLRKNIGTK